MRTLLDNLADEFGPMRMFRPNRDVRFSKDKSPYKLWVGAANETRAIGGTGYYIEVSATGLITGCGAMLMARDRLARFRTALDDDGSGRAFEALHGALATRSLPTTSGAEPPMKTAPRGYSSTHPRSEFPRWKGAAIVQEYDKAAWTHTPGALNEIRTVWRAAGTLKEWLDTHVGSSETPAR